MNAWVALAAGVAAAILGYAAAKLIIRTIALRAAVAFYQAPGTRGDVIQLAAGMERYLKGGYRPR